jgi:hypothetical protein
MSKVV